MSGDDEPRRCGDVAVWIEGEAKSGIQDAGSGDNAFPVRYGSTANRLTFSLGLLGYTDLIEQNARGVDISLKAGKVLSSS